MIQSPVKTIFELYRQRLAPEQNAMFPVAVGPPFRAPEEQRKAVEVAWTRPATHRVTLLAKLWAKGSQPQQSIRYVGQQCVRCIDAGGVTLEAIRCMFTAARLRAYSHVRRDAMPWDLRERAAVYAERSTAEGLKAVVASMTANALFAVVSEHLVAMTVQHASVWRAVRCMPGGLKHCQAVQRGDMLRVMRARSRGGSHAKKGEAADAPSTPSAEIPAGASADSLGGGARSERRRRSSAVLKIASAITSKCSPFELRSALLADTVGEAREAAPAITMAQALEVRQHTSRHQSVLCVTKLASDVAETQRLAVHRRSGIGSLPVAVCRTCTALHAKVDGASKPVKKRCGVSVTIDEAFDMKAGTCATCGCRDGVVVVDAVGTEIRARTRHSDVDPTVVMVCSACACLTTNTTDMHGAPVCKNCALKGSTTKLSGKAKARAGGLPGALQRLRCACGRDSVEDGAEFVLRCRNGTTKAAKACKWHSRVARMFPVNTPVGAKWARHVFRTKASAARRHGARRGQFKRARLRQYGGAKTFTFRRSNTYTTTP